MIAAPVKLTKGTIEKVPINVSSLLDTITTLTGHDLRFDVYTADDAETAIATNMSADNDGMIALPLIDTTAGGLDLAEGKYAIFITFDVNPEFPRLGPFFFQVDD